MLAGTTKTMLATAALPFPLCLRAAVSAKQTGGAISGEPAGEAAGMHLLAEGGNVVDAIVAAALTAAVSAPQMTGMGGYGGHMTIALVRQRKVTSIDFNTAAPAAAGPDMFPLDGDGNVRGRVNEFGWRASGVPGILAGMQLALDRYGTRPFRDCVAPAIALARTGFKLSPGLANTIRNCATQLREDEGSRKLFFKDGTPPAAGEIYRNPDVAAMLTTLAERNSVDSFYRGDIAGMIAGAFQKLGGLVTRDDLAAYRAREVEPLRFEWRGLDVRTAPLTAGGLTILQALGILRALHLDEMPADFSRTHARIEALRFAWRDRLRFLGDPAQSAVPIARLLSREYAAEAAAQIKPVLKEGRFLPFETEMRRQPGTIHLSAVDREGNMAACTLTHGDSFGARVTVDGLGLTLGQGMSRFDPKPGHPNAPGPAKRPLHNMCPTILIRNGMPVCAVGGRGGRHIVNAVFEVVAQMVAFSRNMADAVAAPRLHTEGSPKVSFAKAWPAADVDAAKRTGYTAQTGQNAIVSAVAFDPATHETTSAIR